jgi:hypothetical protein
MLPEAGQIRAYEDTRLDGPEISTAVLAIPKPRLAHLDECETNTLLAAAQERGQRLSCMRCVICWPGYSIVILTLGLERSSVQDADVGGIATGNPKMSQAR